MFDVIFENITVVTVDEENRVLKNAFVGVRNGKIAYIGTEKPKEASAERIPGENKVLMPGLINAHCHLPMTIFRGWADDYELQKWLNEYIFPYEARLDDRSVLVGTVLGIAESIAFGTTSVTDMYGHTDAVLEAAAQSGIKINASNGCMCFSEEFEFDKHSDTVCMQQMHKKWHNYDNGRLKFDASIHAEYTSNYKLWEAVAEYGINNGLIMNIHLSETEQEHNSCMEKYGLTPAQLMDCHNVWQCGGVAAHCVWLTEDDRRLLAKRKISVAHNPISNQKLASGRADIVAMLNDGINVALGTDGDASNNNLDMFEEMKAAALMAKELHGGAEAITAEQILRMATVGGAIAQNRQDECGCIKIGMDADLIMLDFDKPHLTPCHNVVSQLVYSAKGSDVVLNMVRGRILYRDGQFTTLDWKRAKKEIDEYVLPKIFPEVFSGENS